MDDVGDAIPDDNDIRWDNAGVHDDDDVDELKVTCLLLHICCRKLLDD
jgi:hypothetical protein